MTTKKPVASKPPKTAGMKKPAEAKIENVYQALFQFQKGAVTLPRNGRGNVNGREYAYVTLDDLIAGIRPALDTHELVFTQVIAGEKLLTTLVHAPSSTKIESVLNLGNATNMQDYGSRITYARRYALTALLGINAEQDIDASGSTVAPKAPEVPATPTEAVAKAPQERAEAPQATASASEPIPMTLTMSEPFKRAKTAIETCYSIEALGLIEAQIAKSTKLGAEEKAQLTVILDSRRSVILFDAQK